MKLPVTAPIPRPLSSARRLAAFCGVGAASLCALLVLTGHTSSSASPGLPAAGRIRVAAAAVIAPKPRSIDAYRPIESHDLFRPLVVTQTGRRPAGLRTLAPASVDLGTLKLRAVTPAKTVLLPGWSYIGTASVDGLSFALIQTGPNGDYGYYRSGDLVDGFRVVSVAPDAVALVAPTGLTATLPKTSGAAAPVNQSGPKQALDAPQTRPTDVPKVTEASVGSKGDAPASVDPILKAPAQDTSAGRPRNRRRRSAAPDAAPPAFAPQDGGKVNSG